MCIARASSGNRQAEVWGSLVWQLPGGVVVEGKTSRLLASTLAVFDGGHRKPQILVVRRSIEIRQEGKGKSVLNLYHYFNLETCDEEPCRSHADPGLLTVLCRSTEPGLQALHPLKPGGAPGQPAAYEDSWCDLEPMMDALGQGDLGNPENMGML